MSFCAFSPASYNPKRFFSLVRNCLPAEQLAKLISKTVNYL